MVHNGFGRLGFKIENSKFFNICTIIKPYNTLVRLHFEYASQIQINTVYSQTDLIDKAQKRFLRFIYVKPYNTYPSLEFYESCSSIIQ